MIVPYTRALHRGSKGIDVLATKRALAHAHYRRWGFGFTKTAGPRWVTDIRKFQKDHGLKQDGQYGPKTHAKLARYFDRYGARLMSLKKKQLQQATIGRGPAEAVHQAIVAYNNAGLVHYTQSGLRMEIVRRGIKDLAKWFAARNSLYEDCSSSSTGFYYIAGMPDPNDLHYNGQGFTGTIAVHGRRVSTPAPADLGLYGSYPYRHVVIYVGGGRCVSHGSESGPKLTSPYYRSDFSHWRRYV